MRFGTDQHDDEVTKKVQKTCLNNWMAQFKFSNYPVWSVPSSSAVTPSTQSM